MNKTLLTTLLLLPALGGCGTLQDKPALIGFALKHPLAASAIGTEHPQATNITSNAVRISTRLGLDNRANGGGRGTQVNAVRHALWQAAITARFGSRTAEEVGNAYESGAGYADTLDYPDRYRADEAADLRNNAIGRSIGSDHPNRNMQQLAALILAEYRLFGLWTASEQQHNGRTVWRIAQTRLDEAQFQDAMRKLQSLDADGMTPAERQVRQNR